MTLTKALIIYTGLLFGLAGTPSFAQQTDVSGQNVITQAVSINDAVGIALKNNPTIASRKALLKAAAARVGMARAMMRPQVSTSTFANAGNMPMVFPGPPEVQPQNYSLTSDRARLSQNVMGMLPLYTGGNIGGRVNSAKANEEASRDDVITTELDVALAVKTACHQVSRNKLFVDAYQRRVTESQERVRIAQESYNAGRIAKFDLLRNQTELSESLLQLNNAQKDVELAIIDLKNAMGISQISQLTISEDLVIQPPAPSLEDLQASALKQRPEISAARARIRFSQESINVAKSAYKPQVYATAMAELSVSKSTSMASGAESGYLIGITAAIPLLDGGSRSSSIDEARATLEQMRADEQEAIQNVTRDVAGAYVEFNAATKNVSLTQAAVTQSEEDYRVIRMRYEAGKSTNVEVLDALASLTRSQTNYAEALHTQNVARQTLTRAIGQK